MPTLRKGVKLRKGVELRESRQEKIQKLEKVNRTKLATSSRDRQYKALKKRIYTA